jgi:hypothetical protein
MNATVIKYIFQTNVKTKNWFGGFSSPDLPLPTPKKFPTIIVLNTDYAEGAGEHWCLFIRMKKNQNEFFDPYGQPPTLYNFNESLFQEIDKIIYNDTRVQGSLPTCGHHCIFFGINRAMGYSTEHIVKKLYSSDLEKNDHLVFQFIKKTYGDDFASFDM